MTTIRLAKKRFLFLARLHFWMAVLLLTFWYCLGHIFALENNSYAYTYSLGYGVGFTRYTSKYFELSPVLQESVRVHENCHLQNGTWHIWNKAYGERIAYQVQLEDCLQKQAEFWKKYQESKDQIWIEKYSTLHEWESYIRDMISKNS